MATHYSNHCGVQQIPRTAVRHLYRGLSRLHHLHRDHRAARRPEPHPRLPVRVLHAGDLRHHRRGNAHGGGFRVLCRRPPRARVLQRHGHGRRLDVGGLLRRHGRLAVPARLRRHRLGARLDGRLRAGVDPGRAVPAQVRRLHRARLPGVPVRRQLRPLPGRDRARVLLLHLRDGADFRHRPHRLALPRHAVRDRRVRRPRRHPAVRDAGRHAGGDLDADRAVHRADRCLSRADRDPVHADATAFRSRSSPTVRRSRRSRRASSNW